MTFEAMLITVYEVEVESWYHLFFVASMPALYFFHIKIIY